VQVGLAAREARVSFTARDRMRVGSQAGAVYTAPLIVSTNYSIT
jgi:hypothetical protein